MKNNDLFAKSNIDKFYKKYPKCQLMKEYIVTKIDSNENPCFDCNIGISICGSCDQNSQPELQLTGG